MLLAVDTSTQQVGIALFDGAQIIGEMIWRTKNHHTVEIAAGIEEILKKTGVDQDDLTGLGVALGPGSFTSLRIGLAIVKGLALSLHIPVSGVPTHDIVASLQPVSQYPLGAIIQAGRGRLAIAWYKNHNYSWVPDGNPEILNVNQLLEKIIKPTILCGELTAEERQVLSRQRKNVILASPIQSVRRPGQLAEIAWKKIRKHDFDDIASLAPIYLHVGDPIPE